jgi:hypothetical protein
VSAQAKPRLLGRLRAWIERMSVRLDEAHLAAHRMDTPGAHPALCDCRRCERTVPEHGFQATHGTEPCPRCHLVNCSPECIAAEQAEEDAIDARGPRKFA